MVKPFDRNPHHLLAREAAALMYPLWMVRLATATYRPKRVLRIGGALSAEVLTNRGITAGPSNACTEMRFVLIRIIDRAWDRFPTVTHPLFVDDLSAENTAPEKRVIEQLGGFVDCVASDFEKEGLELSSSIYINIYIYIDMLSLH